MSSDDDALLLPPDDAESGGDVVLLPPDEDARGLECPAGHKRRSRPPPRGGSVGVYLVEESHYEPSLSSAAPACLAGAADRLRVAG